ncbi:MAG TPA: electron transfer flavoprotein-ubiquinone oxidoreductase [Planctomycetes bacterium]|nr:electron transfer flavoprotein-ubiquinone oxidoreductase [Planctomycetota bacterium]HIK59400.1 electron transfer flavoprotein-ubiquinone oxidoreductase [Planctomycetota bacterium]
MSHHPTSLNLPDVEREELPVDVLLVGAGPASLSCAIHLKRLFEERGMGDKEILVIDKAKEIGHHTLSGAVMDPRGIAELFPDWRERGFPVISEVGDDWAEWLRPGGKHWTMKGPLCPPQLKNHGNLMVSLNRVVGWLAEQAEQAEIMIQPGFPAAQTLYEGERVVGIDVRDGGIAKDGSAKANFEAGARVRAEVTVFAEGTRGSLAKQLFARHDLCAGKNPQTYGTGIKELWRVREEVGREMHGKVFHTGGYPLHDGGYGGSWVYGVAPDQVSIGFVVGLDHGDAALDPHALFVQWKQHERIRSLLEGGEVLRYGAKTVPEGGYHSMPKLFGDGFVLVGDSAGFLNAASLKGIHLAIKSGMLAAEAIADALQAGDTSAQGLAQYGELFEASWAKDELWSVRNYRQAFASGLSTGMLDFAVQQVTGGRGLQARRSGHEDHTCMQSAAQAKLAKPKFNDADSMDKLTDVYLSGAIHEEDQPSHLLVVDPTICVERCTQEYGNPCQHFCPAAVYEWPEGTDAVVINASNCVHCKTCDIADPYENIEWLVPEGGGGPKYVDM